MQSRTFILRQTWPSKKHDNIDNNKNFLLAPAPGAADSQECLLEEELKKERASLFNFRALFDFQIWFQLQTETDL